MLKILKPLVMLAVWMIAVSPAWSLMVAEETNFQTMSEQLEEAIEAHNFQKARETFELLLPMIKTDLKEAKKTLAQLQKSGSSVAEIKAFEQALNDKSTLYESLKGVAEMSTAALRVQAPVLLEQVKKYTELHLKMQL